MAFFISPTGRNEIRGMDQWGSGYYGTPRVKASSRYSHKGADFVCNPGQKIIAPFDGFIDRIALPYSDGPYMGFVFEGLKMSVKIFYADPYKWLSHKTVLQGEEIGVAQDIGKRYPGIIPHIHVEFVTVDPELFLEAK